VNVERHQSCTYCGFKTALREQEGDQLPACTICVLTKDMDTRTALVRIANMLLRELNEVRALAKKALEGREE
jgi:hypothetical protein